MSALACVDLFCGAGGLSHGLIAEGLTVNAGIDIDAACKHAFEANNNATFHHQDISTVSPESLRSMFGNAEVRVLAGCAPCQPFSTYAQRYDTLSGPRWALLYQFSRLIRGTHPHIVTMENVPLVEKHKVFQDFVNDLQSQGYKVCHRVVDCSRHGLPQSRKRMVLLASKIGAIEIKSPFASNRVITVRDAIGALDAIEQGSASAKDPLHIAARLSETNLARIRASAPGGTWRDWPSSLIAECHRRGSGNTYSSVYGRMHWDQPSPTMTTQFYGFGNGRFGHPDQDRAISLREGAILQGFPSDYSFLEAGKKVQFRTLGRMIGNAVPVALGRIIGSSIKQHVQDALGMSFNPHEVHQAIA